MKIFDLSLAGSALAFIFVGKSFSHVCDGLSFPVGNHIRMQVVTAAQLRQGVLALDCLKANLVLEVKLNSGYVLFCS